MHYNMFVGLTHLYLNISNQADTKKTMRLSFLIDSGVLYTVVPEKYLEKLGIKKDSKRRFILGNGEIIERHMGGGFFEYKDKKAFAPVTFGEKDDLAVLGITALESLGYGLDPMKRKLIDLPLLI